MIRAGSWMSRSYVVEGLPKVATLLYTLVGRSKSLAKDSSADVSSGVMGCDERGPANGPNAAIVLILGGNSRPTSSFVGV